ncbi:MAG: hypothetical protein KAQ89_00345 [Planctomycetes bacterium]|nr:hypothetical protein [Planctomycetota bacterium]
MNLYEELGNIQFQIDKLEAAKINIVRQIEIQMTIEATRKQAIDDSAKP